VYRQSHTVPLSSLLDISPERNPGSRVTYLDGDYAWDVQMPGRQIKSESVMAGLYLGIAVTGVNALVATGLVIAFM
jgi:hypothetical protein